MSEKLIVLAHGIGDSKNDFYKEWADVIANNHDLKNVVVKGLWWEDVLQKVADKYPLISRNMADLIARCGFADLEKWVGNPSWKEFQDYIMDVLVYAGLSDMWQYIQDKCALKLDELRKDKNGKEIFEEADTILIGHSLGAAMLPHLVWREYEDNMTIPYRGMILLASPLGFKSPMPQICEDFMQRMDDMQRKGEMSRHGRNDTIARFARIWNKGGENRLKFICNENDIVCSNVKYDIPTIGEVNLIPLQMGFDPAEINILNSEHKGCFESISFGKRDPSKISDNHDVLTYLKHDAFNKALDAML